MLTTPTSAKLTDVLADSLGSYYRTIGLGLRLLEESCQYHDILGAHTLVNSAAIQDFRRYISAIPTSILESYLEDLLDRRITNDRLYISDHRSFISRHILLILFLTCLLLFISAVIQLQIEHTFFSLTVLGLGALISIILSQRDSRRLNFARIISREIAHRKGHTDDGQIIAAATAKQDDKRTRLTSKSLPHPTRVTILSKGY